jgi:hypothetical protein
MYFDYSDSQISFADSFYPDSDYPIRRPELLSWVPLIPLQKLLVRFSPGRLEKTPHIWGQQ